MSQEKAVDTEPNILEFWVAYQEDAGLKHYLGNGKGGVRLFKSKEAIDTFLQEHLSQPEIDRTVVHSVTGNFIVPEPEAAIEPEPITIKTLHLDTLPPTAEDFLNDIRQTRKRHKGKHHG